MRLKYTRAMIAAALNGELNNVNYTEHPQFGLQMPSTCPGVTENILNPRNTWANRDSYDDKANQLATEFTKNFEKYAMCCDLQVISAGPNLTVSV